MRPGLSTPQKLSSSEKWSVVGELNETVCPARHTFSASSGHKCSAARTGGSPLQSRLPLPRAAPRGDSQPGEKPLPRGLPAGSTNVVTHLQNQSPPGASTLPPRVFETREGDQHACTMPLGDAARESQFRTQLLGDTEGSKGTHRWSRKTTEPSLQHPPFGPLQKAVR